MTHPLQPFRKLDLLLHSALHDLFQKLVSHLMMFCRTNGAPRFSGRICTALQAVETLSTISE